MPTNVTWNGTTYPIPLAGELNWSSLSSFLIDVGNNAAVAQESKQAVRVATTSPVTVAAATDYAVITDLSVAGAVTVNLPAGVNGQIFVIVDGKGDAGTNNITINRNGSDTIKGSTSLVLDHNNESVVLIYHAGTTDWKVLDLNLYPSTIRNADISATAAIARSKTASGTANHVLINDGSGVMSSEAVLAGSRGGLHYAFDTTGIQSGQVPVYNGTSFVVGSSGDSSFKIQSVAADGTVVIKGGFFELYGNEYGTYDGAGNNESDYGADLTFDLDAVSGVSGDGNYYLYVDRTLAGTPTATTDTFRVIGSVTSSAFVASTTAPSSRDRTRYKPIGTVRRISGSWSTTLFTTYSSKVANSDTYYTNTFTSAPAATIAHSLGAIPKYVSVMYDSAGDGKYSPLDAGSYVKVDATNIYTFNFGDLTIDATNDLIISATL